MSQEDEEIKRQIDLYEDESGRVVDRQAQSSVSIVPIIIFFVVIYLLFHLYSENEAVIQSITKSVKSKVTIPQQFVPNSLSKESSLHNVIPKGKVADIKLVLLSNRETINDVIDGMTPMMLAASRGNVDIIELLFTLGADPNKRGSMERTALQYAAEKNHIEAVKRLLSYGADIDAYDNGRLTPLIMAASRGYTDLGLLFVEKGADVNIQHIDGWTALIDAAAHGDTQLVVALLNAGANKELSAKNGMKAIDYARQYGFNNLVKILSD